MNRQIIIIREIFYFLSFLSVGLVLLEMIFPDIVTSYFNLNYLFLAWLINALLCIRIRK